MEVRLSFSRESVRREVGIREGDKRFGVLRCERLHEGISRLVFSPCMELGIRMRWQSSQEKGQSEVWISSVLGWKLGRAEGSSIFEMLSTKQIFPKVTGRG